MSKTDIEVTSMEEPVKKPVVTEEVPLVDDVVPEKELVPEYVHVPGTVHINAYYGAVEEAKVKLMAAQSELDEAIRALEDKKSVN